MELIQLVAPLGVEVRGVDASRPLSEPDRLALRDALARNGVLLVRGQALNPDQFVAFARAFGDIEMYSSTLSQYLMPRRPEIIVLSNIVENGKPIGVADGGSYWHTDRSYVAKPAWASCLYSLEIPHADDGTPLGDTAFASMTAAYEALPQDKKALFGTLRAWHEYVFRFSEKNDSMPGVSHPLILKHPLTGAPCLYVNKGFTHRILGLPEDEAKALIEWLFEYTVRPQFVYRHQWRVGDFLVWDNYSTQHWATGGYKLPQRRHMWRTTIQGFELQ